MHNLSASGPKSALLLACFVAMLCLPRMAFAQRYSQTNLVSDIPGLAAVTDSNLVNPWGISFSDTSPFWVADNGTGVATLYTPAGAPVQLLPLVNIPAPTGSTSPATPTGTGFNGTGGFVVSSNGLSGPSLFLFATEDGTISGWNPNVDFKHAILAVDNSTRGTVYKGLALIYRKSKIRFRRWRDAGVYTSRCGCSHAPIVCGAEGLQRCSTLCSREGAQDSASCAVDQVSSFPPSE